MKLRLHVFTIANKKLGDQNPHTVPNPVIFDIVEWDVGVKG